jgi:hypothetical protein
VFDAGYVVESIKQTVDGKEKRFQNKTPISFILSPANGTTGNSGTNSGSQGGTNTGDNGGNQGGGTTDPDYGDIGDGN